MNTPHKHSIVDKQSNGFWEAKRKPDLGISKVVTFNQPYFIDQV